MIIPCVCVVCVGHSWKELVAVGLGMLGFDSLEELPEKTSIHVMQLKRC